MTRTWVSAIAGASARMNCCRSDAGPCAIQLIEMLRSKNKMVVVFMVSPSRIQKESSALRSGRKHKAWGVSPGNDKANNHGTCGTGDCARAFSDETTTKFECEPNDFAVARDAGWRFLHMEYSCGPRPGLYAIVRSADSDQILSSRGD